MELMTDSRDDLLAYPDGGPTFDVVRKGYGRERVEETLAGLDADLRVALADRDAAVSRSADLARQLQALHGEVESLRRPRGRASAPAAGRAGPTRVGERGRAHREHAAAGRGRGRGDPPLRPRAGSRPAGPGRG